MIAINDRPVRGGAQMNMDSGLTPAQGRVVFHSERLLRSTGADPQYARDWRQRCLDHCLPVLISDMTVEECRRALQLLEKVCYPMALVRDLETDWRDLS